MTTQPADLPTRLLPALPTPSMVTLLQAIESDPAVSLLMSTTPASRMLPEDAERLLGMARDAEARLLSESLPGVRGTILRPTSRLPGADRAPPSWSAGPLHRVRLRPG